MDPKTYTGLVLNGKKRGTALGFPTLNIPLNDSFTSGIYIGKVEARGETHEAAIFADQKRGLLEAYLLDFEGNLYGETITVTLLDRLRDSREFDDDEKLKAEIMKDVETVRWYFKNKEA